MLSDVQILARLNEPEDSDHLLIITPMICAPEQIGPSSVDVHLGTKFESIDPSNRTHVDPLMSKLEYQEWLKHVVVIQRSSVLEPFVLHPRAFARATTLEFICLPKDLAARIEGRSSWARQGLKVHATAGNVHPGSRGFVIFELGNDGELPLLLYPGMPIAQLTFEELGVMASEGYSQRRGSKYVGFRQTLSSGFPDDVVLRSMRLLKDEHETRLGVRQRRDLLLEKESDAFRSFMSLETESTPPSGLPSLEREATKEYFLPPRREGPLGIGPGTTFPHRREFMIVIKLPENKVRRVVEALCTAGSDPRAFYKFLEEKYSELAAEYPGPSYDIFVGSGDLRAVKSALPYTSGWEEITPEMLRP